jgi:hypothetical protein
MQQHTKENTMTIQQARELSGHHQQAHHGGGPSMALLVGGLCGLAWAAGLRGFMAQIAGPESTVDWAGTFGWILVPGIGVGALLGWAEHLRTSGGRRGWRWLALSPLLFSAILFSRPLDMLSIFEDGLGGGAIGVPLYGMLGGYALAGSGPRWARIVSGAVAGTAIPIWALTVTSLAGPGLAVDTPRRLGRRALLVVPGGPGARLRHPTSSSHATARCLTLMEPAVDERGTLRGQPPSPQLRPSDLTCESHTHQILPDGALTPSQQ